MRLVHVINCLSVGGAERQLLRIAAAQRRSGDDVLVLTLLDKDTLRPEAERMGVPVRRLGLRGGGGVRRITAALALPGALRRLRREVDAFAPDTVQAWLYWANLASMLALGRDRRRRRVPLAWNIRQTLPAPGTGDARERRVMALGARWSRGVDALVYNAEAARDQHREAGYHAAVETVIPNAFDVDAAPHGEEARAAARAALGLPPDALAMAHAARLHPMKDHEGFLDACAGLLERRRDLVAILFGRDVLPERIAGALGRRASLRTALDEGRLRFEGERLDLAQRLPAFDLFVSSSAWGEAFPNVVAEAMAAGVPVVATDVGESRALVGDTGAVVPPRSPEALAAAIEALLERTPAERASLGAAARARVAERCSVDAVLDAYRRLWASLR